MSSTGTISRVFINPTTSHAETQRSTNNSISSMAGPHEQTKKATGRIVRLHPDKPRLVKINALDGTPLANGSWVELNHSAQEIAERWGTVRTGFRVRVHFSGPSGAGADATIIGTEGKDVTEPSQPNDVARGLFAAFPPGIGL